MKRKIHVCTVFGTRPEAIKLAPLIKELGKQKEAVRSTVIVTAQHREMLDQVLELFNVKADYDLNIMRRGQRLDQIVTRSLSQLTNLFIGLRPDLVIVHGDTSTTFTAALAAFYLRIPVAHVEAGLRTMNRFFPFPEEMNRRFADEVSTIYFAPTESAKANLLNRGIRPEEILVTGNTVVDAELMLLRKNYTFKNEVLGSFVSDAYRGGKGWRGAEQIEGRPRRIVLTVHRRENWGPNLVSICDALVEFLNRREDVRVLIPAHRNPLVRRLLKERLSDLIVPSLPGRLLRTAGAESRPLKRIAPVTITEPLPYDDFINLIARIDLILTDSGGIQEEVCALNKPAFVLRRETERPEAVEAGLAKVIGVERSGILNALEDWHRNQRPISSSEWRIAKENPFGDGKAGQRIVKYILKWFRKNVKAPIQTDFGIQAPRRPAEGDR